MRKAMKHRLIPESLEREVLIYAFRYALGRRSAAVHTMADLIRGAWPELSAGDKKLIQREIKHAVEHGLAGDNVDVREWETILRLEGEK